MGFLDLLWWVVWGDEQTSLQREEALWGSFGGLEHSPRGREDLEGLHSNKMLIKLRGAKRVI